MASEDFSKFDPIRDTNRIVELYKRATEAKAKSPGAASLIDDAVSSSISLQNEIAMISSVEAMVIGMLDKD